MNMAEIKWGMIGCGSVTEIKSAPAYQKTEGFVLQGVMSRTFSNAKAYAERHGIPNVFKDADALINHPEIDAVYIATPPDSHEFYALKVARAGKICCIEKPMAPNYKSCLKITKAFEAGQIPLFVAYYRRSLPRFQMIKGWLEAEEIGDISEVNWHFTKAPNAVDISKSYNWRTDSKIAPGGYFDDLASHGLDLFNFLLGNIESANGKSENKLGLYSAKNVVSATWHHASGVKGIGSWDFTADKRQDEVHIKGSLGSIAFSVFGDNPVIKQIGGFKEYFDVPNPKHIQSFHVQNMKDHIQNKSSHPSTGASATHTAWVMDQILGN